MKSKTILIISSDFPPQKGGIQTLAYSIAKELAKTYKVFVLSGNKDSTDINEDFTVFTFNGGSRKMSFISSFFSSRKYIKKIKPDVILHTLWHTALYSRLLDSNKSYIMAHGTDIVDGSFFTYYLRKYILSKVNKILCVSKYTQNIISTITNNNSSIIPCGVNTDIFNSITKDTSIYKDSKIFYVLFLGRLIKRKSCDTLILAISELTNQNNIKIKLIIAGDGPEKQDLIFQVQKLNLNDYIEFHNEISDSKRINYYSGADVFVLPAVIKNKGKDYEGFGISIIEASSCSTAVIASKSAGMTDAVIDNKTGILIKENSVEELKNAILKLYNNPELKDEYAKNGRIFATTKYSNNNMGIALKKEFNPSL